MIVQVRVRRNKIPAEAVNADMQDEWLYFDNCTEVRCGAKPLKKVTGKDFAAFLEANKTEPKGRTVHKMVKDPQECGVDEKYHYNMIEWKDAKTGKPHLLVFDTIVFILNDEGKNLRKLDG